MLVISKTDVRHLIKMAKYFLENDLQAGICCLFSIKPFTKPSCKSFPTFEKEKEIN